jgi:exodeoxyribonuclease V alpha subunit
VRLLSANHRFAGSLAELAAAVRAGDAVRALAVLGRGDDSVAWVDADPSLLIGQLDPGPGDDEPPSAARVLSGHLRGWASEVVEAATAGELGAAVTAFSGHRLLCAHRHGPAGVAVWNTAVEALSGRDPFAGAWYAGRPVLVTANDYGLRLFNGDTGVTVALPPAPEGSGAAPAAAPPAVGHRQVPVLRVAFGDGRRLIGPSRLDAVETVFAMTVHKSQGSEYDQVTFVVPGADSQLLTRELLYTALTRARRRVLVVGTADSVERAVTRPVARASGLTERIRRG